MHAGIVGIFYYSKGYLMSAGLSDKRAGYATLGVGATMVAMALVSIPLVDKLGRRTLHLGGLVGMVVFGSVLTILQVGIILFSPAVLGFPTSPTLIERNLCNLPVNY